MKNTNINSIYMGMKVLAVLAFALLVIPTKAGAYYPPNGYSTPYGSYGAINYNTPPQGGYPLPVNYYVAPVTPVVYPSNPAPQPAPATVTPAQTEPVANTDTSKPEENYSNLAASAIIGSNNLMPSGIIQWILFFILVLVIVILVRKIFGAESKYHSTPMKHA